MLSSINPEIIQDLEGARQAIRALLNLVEELKSENTLLREEVQQLRDEIARLKGEQGKPEVKASKKRKGKTIHRRRSGGRGRNGRRVERRER